MEFKLSILQSKIFGKLIRQRLEGSDGVAECRWPLGYRLVCVSKFMCTLTRHHALRRLMRELFVLRTYAVVGVLTLRQHTCLWEWLVRPGEEHLLIELCGLWMGELGGPRLRHSCFGSFLRLGFLL